MPTPDGPRGWRSSLRSESHAASEPVHAPMLPGTLVRAPTSHPKVDDILAAAVGAPQRLRVLPVAEPPTPSQARQPARAPRLLLPSPCSLRRATSARSRATSLSGRQLQLPSMPLLFLHANLNLNVITDKKQKSKEKLY